MTRTQHIEEFYDRLISIGVHPLFVPFPIVQAVVEKGAVLVLIKCSNGVFVATLRKPPSVPIETLYQI